MSIVDTQNGVTKLSDKITQICVILCAHMYTHVIPHHILYTQFTNFHTVSVRVCGLVFLSTEYTLGFTSVVQEYDSGISKWVRIFRILSVHFGVTHLLTPIKYILYFV